MAEFVFIFGAILATILLIKACFYLITFILSIYGRNWGIGVKYVSSNGEYVVITGATGAIGREYAQEFASMAFNLVLISRNAEKLDLVEKHLAQKYPNVKNIVKIVADFTKLESFEQIKARLHEIKPIVALVNATGYCQMPNNYWKYEPGTNSQLVMVNVLAPVIMMDILLPRFIEQKRGIVINVGSHAGDFRFPYYSTFSASKSFIHTLTEIIGTECKKSGIYFQTVKPCFVSSTTKHDLRSSLFKISPRYVAYSSLMLVGIETSTYGYWKHKLTGLFFNAMVFVFGHRLTTLFVGWLIWTYVRFTKEKGEGSLLTTKSSPISPKSEKITSTHVSSSDDNGDQSTSIVTKNSESVSISIKEFKTQKFISTPDSKRTTTTTTTIQIMKSEPKPKEAPSPQPALPSSKIIYTDSKISNSNSNDSEITRFPITGEHQQKNMTIQAKTTTKSNVEINDKLSSSMPGKEKTEMVNP